MNNMSRIRLLGCAALAVTLGCLASMAVAQDKPKASVSVEDDYYRILSFTTPAGEVLEAGALEQLPGGKVAMGTRRGEIWILENAYDQTARLVGVAASEIGGAGEAALLEEAKGLMASLPFDDIDVLVVDEMGKYISGTGMDTNIIGRMLIRGVP